MCIRLTIALLTVSISAGCGDSGIQSHESQAGILPRNTETVAPSGGVTAALAGPQNDPAEDGSHVGGSEDTGERDPVAGLLSEIELLQVNGGAKSTQNDHRNSEIVLKATEVLKRTMQDPARETDFLAAVRHLLQARLQTALTGSAADIDQLYADVQALSDRDPKSAPAAEGIFHLAKFAHTKARQVRQKKAAWNVSFSRWAREFATRFPRQSERALSLLFGAGRSCEMTAATADTDEESALLRTEARLCYVLLMEKWPREPQGQEAVAVLRRLELPGRKLSQFSGPTLSGGKVTAQRFQGKVTVIYFWDSESHGFIDRWLPLLKQAETQLPSEDFQLIGVNLDDDLDQCRQTIRDLAIPGEQIVFQDGSRRGWNSPLVRFWGVSQSPSVWIVDSVGVVNAVDVRREALATRLKPLIRARSSGNLQKSREL
ncbi:MAG: thioredoxin family protein [Planctomycetaceae bacterium]